eukprot:CAMPEP_0175057452 /NCGR_PEP_ID=MMETSP0052_2-20121109/11272_1 /TAXON_ID=51329 ORGANISM="Polytomella parva, Strain SAG 63-3" /NCGR_SAMPLE_ID=MMETSP0052_2 /ASSEMBLY_ACC=CAM_ASM_000194 /LENGTH=329 /DNA_ID=CAMNT_0016322667 /DNA_START=395 /DNA_END=1385 /DNA_ORIENTATION=-
MINNDSVIRTTHYKYFHPKEVYISDGILNRAIVTGAGKSLPNLEDDIDYRANRAAFDNTGLDFVYPYGATVSALKPAVPILSSGKIAYPMNRPLAAVCDVRTAFDRPNAGKIMVLGSVMLFDDKWVDKEDNSKLMDFVFKYLRPSGSQDAPTVSLNALDAEEPEISDLKLLPDTATLAEKLKGCLQEVDDVPRDWTSLFEDNPFKFDTGLIPEAVSLYDRLNVKKAALSLIAPSFETPLPPLLPAVFPPTIREPAPPALELFDLDESFASETSRLATLTNKCSGEADLDYFVMEAGSIVGLRLPEDATAKTVLAEIFRKIANVKWLVPD